VPEGGGEVEAEGRSIRNVIRGMRWLLAEVEVLILRFWYVEGDYRNERIRRTRSVGAAAKR
jgi:hypothetical protein